MKITKLPIEGHYEDISDAVSETMRVIEPENDLEKGVLAHAILAQPMTLDDADSARRDYSFAYTVGEYLERGMFRLHVKANDASDEDHAAEIAAVLATPGSALNEDRRIAYVPMWLISKRHHFKSTEGDDGYPGPSFGRLRRQAVDLLPHRRLFGAQV